MDDNEQILTGQQAQQNLPRGLDTSLANTLLPEVRSRAARRGTSIGQYGTNVRKGTLEPGQGTSGLIKNLINNPSSRGDDGLYDTDQIQNRRNVGWVPSYYKPGLFVHTEDETSSMGTIIKDSVKQFGMSLLTLEDKAYVALGGIISTATGNEFGTILRDRAYESLDAKLYDISLVSTRASDAETLTSKVTMGAASMLEMMTVGAMTGGLAPLIQMGTDVLGSGMYNNMREYAEKNGGSIEGFEGNWVDIGIDLGNAAFQVVIEKKFGVGSSRFFTGKGGSMLREALNGFLQESSQEFLTDFGEYLKDNEEANIFAERWQDYLVAGAIGGVLQGALGAATYKNSRAHADDIMQNMATQVIAKANPNMAENLVRKKARAFTKAFNDNQEKALATEGYQEINDRIEANLDKGRVRDVVMETELAHMSGRGEDVSRARSIIAQSEQKGADVKNEDLQWAQQTMKEWEADKTRMRSENLSVQDAIDIQARTTRRMKDVIQNTYTQGKPVMLSAAEQYQSTQVVSAETNSAEYYLENAFKAWKGKTSKEFQEFWNPIAEKYNLQKESVFLDRQVLERMKTDFDAGNLPSQEKIQNMIQERGAKIEKIKKAQKIKKSKEDAARVISDEITKRYEDTQSRKKERSLAKRLREMGVEMESDTYAPLKLAEMQGDAETAIRMEGGIEYAFGVLNGKIKNSAILRETWYVALENYANETADAALVDRLRGTGMAAEATEMGQRIAALKDYNMVDGRINGKRAVDIIESSLKKLNEADQKEYSAALDSFVKTLAESDEKGAAKIAAVIKNWECK